MKKAPHYEVPLSQSRFEIRQEESSSTQKNYKHEIAFDSADDRTELTSLDWLANPSAPITDEAMEGFIEEAAQLLTDTLSELEHGKEHQPC